MGSMQTMAAVATDPQSLTDIAEVSEKTASVSSIRSKASSKQPHTPLGGQKAGSKQQKTMDDALVDLLGEIHILRCRLYFTHKEMMFMNINMDTYMPEALIHYRLELSSYVQMWDKSNRLVATYCLGRHVPHNKCNKLFPQPQPTVSTAKHNCSTYHSTHVVRLFVQVLKIWMIPEHRLIT